MAHCGSSIKFFTLVYIISLRWFTYGTVNISSRNTVSSPKCGVQLFADRIVGGNVTSIYDYPWSAILKYHNEQRQTDSWGCGGAYIGGRTVITAAHCVDNISRRDLGELQSVRLGEYDTETNPDCIEYEDDNDCNDPPFDSTVTSILIHPKRNESSKEYDIAIIILDKKPPYSDFIRPICLPDLAENDLFNPDEILYVTGWGWTVGYVRSPSNVKRHIRIDAVHHDVCRKQYEKIVLNPTHQLCDGKQDSNEKVRVHFQNSQLCAGGKGGLNPCRGDSGGALMRLVRGTYWQLIGLVSFGPGVCAIEGVDGKAAVFTKVNYFIPFIVQNSL